MRYHVTGKISKNGETLDVDFTVDTMGEAFQTMDEKFGKDKHKVIYMEYTPIEIEDRAGEY
jgi:hypothetical protein